MNIGLDFDDVIADTSRLLSDLTKEFYGVEIPPIDFRDSAAEQILTAQQYDKVWELAFYSRRALDVKPIPGALDYLPNLIRDNDVRVITARGPGSAKLASRWLDERNISMKVVCTSDSDKAPFCRDLDIFVDDAFYHVVSVLHIVRSPVHFCYYDSESLDSVHKVSSWEQLYSYIGQLADD